MVSRSSLLFSLQLTFRTAPVAALVWTLTSMIMGLIPGLQAWTLTALVEQLSRPELASMLYGIPTALLCLGAISIGQMLITLLFQLSIAHTRNRMGSRSMELLLQKATRIAPIDFERDDLYDRLHRAKANTYAPFDQMRLALDVGSVVVSLLSFLFYVQSLSVGLALVFAGCMLLYSIQMFVQSRVEFRMYQEHAADERKLNYLAQLMTDKSFGKEMRVFRMFSYLYNRWKTASSRLIERYLQVIRRNHLMNLFLTTFGFSIVLVFFAWVAVSVSHGDTSVAAFAGLVSFIGQLGDLISEVGYKSRDLNLTRLRVRNLQEFLQVTETESTGGREALPIPDGAIRLQGVSFTYPGQQKPALQEIDLHIQPGETIGIVGENGAGKSTLAHLLSGLYRPTGGQMWWEDRPFHEVVATVPHAVGVVYQKPLRYEMSMEENLFLDREGSSEQLAAVIADMQLGDIVSQLPEGAQTHLGKAFGVVDLSGGQWQRLAIARGYLQDPALYVLDEPTAALDPEAEATVFRLFRRLSQDKTSVIISHRLGSLQDVDRIVVMQHGRIAEIGSHEELLARAGEYHRLYHLQAQWYQEVN